MKKINQKKQKKKNEYNLPTLKIDRRKAIGKAAYEKLDNSPYAKSKRSHKRRKASRISDGIKYPCKTYKEGYQFTEEYKAEYRKEILENNKKVI